VLRQAAERIGVKALAARLRLSPALVYKWCQESSADDADASGARNPLDRLRELVEATQDVGPVKWICAAAGGFFAPNPPSRDLDRDTRLLQTTQRMVAEFSELLTTVSASVGDDGIISAAEAQRIRTCWDDLKSIGESFAVACERGFFSRSPRTR
jgi:hypothetical protein